MHHVGRVRVGSRGLDLTLAYWSCNEPQAARDTVSKTTAAHRLHVLDGYMPVRLGQCRQNTLHELDQRVQVGVGRRWHAYQGAVHFVAVQDLGFRSYARFNPRVYLRKSKRLGRAKLCLPPALPFVWG